ncbi:uncharacterized protein LOC142176126 [Nicotiana tabacum]|uniref:Uncharacterized protein LOC142176126 n=1 Tax=Nicotiana tabacum TaxID=4097 RepID=A0AC58TQ07_TOBAC
MAEEAVRVFQAQFHEDSIPTTFGIMYNVPKMVEMRHNEELIKQPTIEEVKKVVFGLNRESAGGPDSFNGCFFHACWDTIWEDVFDMVRAFFNKFMTHTNLVLLPKKKKVTTF